MGDAPVIPRFSQMRGKAFTPGRADIFLEAIASGSEDKDAAEYAGVTLNGVRDRQRNDPKFNHAYRIAREARIETYRAEMRRRAVEGTVRPVFYRGEQVGGVREYSDRLLEVLAKAEDPDTFGDRKVIEVAVSPMTGNDVAQALSLGSAAGRDPELLAALVKVAEVYASEELVAAVAGEVEDAEFEDVPS